MSEFDTTLGALCVSYALAWALFGAMSMQCAGYYQKFPKDNLWLKLLVAFLWVFDTLQLVLIGQGAYYWVITHYGDPAILAADSPRTIFLAILVTVNTLPFTANGSYSTFSDEEHPRLYGRNVLGSSGLYSQVAHPSLHNLINSFPVSNRNVLLTGFIVAFSTTYFGLQLVTQVKMWEFKKLALLYKVQTVTSVSLACAATADMSIAAALVIFLRRSRTGINATDRIVNRLGLYAMNTGLLTSIVVLMDMICFLTMPDNFIHLGILVISGKLYTNSLLASLNLRSTVRHNDRNINLNTTLSLSAMATPPSTGYKFPTPSNSKTLDMVEDRTMNISSANDGKVNDEDYAIRSVSERKFHDAI
ncbi:hypothetical protein K438DRAFT_1987900 [Mycena galopus ATCC 62051]|nr:hypothetical protein K438DRAFT_1987900 [Mycena galopus ATCC 62051]